MGVKRPSFLEKEGPAVSSNAPHRPLRRLALALAAAGLLAASLSIVDRPSGGKTPATASAVGPTFDPLLDTGPGTVCGPIAGTAMKIPAAWLVAAVAKTETAPFQPHPMKAAGGDVPLYSDLGTLAFPITTRKDARRPISTRACGSRSPSTMPRRSARSRRRRSSTRTARCASGARR